MRTSVNFRPVFATAGFRRIASSSNLKSGRIFTNQSLRNPVRLKPVSWKTSASFYTGTPLTGQIRRIGFSAPALKQSTNAAASTDEPTWIFFHVEVKEWGWKLAPGKKYTVGRTEDNDICVPMDTISGAHALLEVDKKGENVFITDLGSTNGTQVSVAVMGKEMLKSIDAETRIPLESGQAVVFADEDDGMFLLVDPNAVQEEEDDDDYYYEEEPEKIPRSGPELDVEALKPSSNMIGDGSFGQVFLGSLQGIGDVVLKRTKARVGGAQQMLELELEMNSRVSQRSPGVSPPYLGYCEVSRAQSGELYNKQLTEGLWLVWEYQSKYTLEAYLNESSYPRGFLKAMGENTDAGEFYAAQIAMKSLVQNLESMHKEKLVHRDVKPSNLLIAPPGMLQLIDLGACADLKDGFNYEPGNCPRDPTYCPPECDLMPEEAAVDERGRLRTDDLKALWTEFEPDRFDVFAAGIVLMQLAIPKLRRTKAAEAFSRDLQKCNYDLEEWKSKAKLSPGETAVLDENNGAGWNLVSQMLQPAPWAGAAFNAKRPSAKEVLAHRFFK